MKTNHVENNDNVAKTSGKNTKKRGPMPMEIDWNMLDAILQFKSPLRDAAEILGCSEDTIQNRIREKFDMTFMEYRDLKMSKVRYNLSMKQYEIAKNGNVTMLIWLGKQWLGQKEKQEIEHSKGVGFEDLVSYMTTVKENAKK